MPRGHHRGDIDRAVRATGGRDFTWRDIQESLKAEGLDLPGSTLAVHISHMGKVIEVPRTWTPSEYNPLKVYRYATRWNFIQSDERRRDHGHSLNPLEKEDVE